MSIPMIHETDLFHPPADPDDHYDLACVFALAALGLVDLRGVVVDHPPPHLPQADPAVPSVAQLNRIAGTAVPVVTGAGRRMTTRDDRLTGAARHDNAAAEFILRTLREASDPVVINISGSSEDVAIAANRDPALVAERCAAIYLNAGVGLPDASDADLEYNTALAPHAFARIFDLPCPVYWMPCFGALPFVAEVLQHGTFYQVRQSEILPALSAELQAYFLFALNGEPATQWLRYLGQAPQQRQSPRRVAPPATCGARPGSSMPPDTG